MWRLIFDAFVLFCTISSDGQFCGPWVRMNRFESFSVMLNVIHSAGLPVTVPCITCQTPRNCSMEINHINNENWRKIDQILTFLISKSFIASTSGHCPILNWNAVINEIRKARRKNEIAIFSRWSSILSWNKFLIKLLMLLGQRKATNWMLRFISLKKIFVYKPILTKSYQLFNTAPLEPPER